MSRASTEPDEKRIGVDADGSNVIARIPRGNNRELRIEWGSYRDHKFVDCRLWIRIGDDFRPSRAGVTIPPNQIADVIDALERAKATEPAGER